MTEQEYRDAIKPYTIGFKWCDLISHQAGQGDGNAWIATLMHYFVLQQNGWLNPDDILNLYRCMESCCPKATGLVQRTPEKPDLQSHDDLEAICGLSTNFVGLKFVSQISRYFFIDRKAPWYLGGRVKGIYNTETPGEYNTPSGQCAWLGRMFNLRAHIKYSNNETPTVFERFVWALDVKNATGAEKSNQDSWFLTWCMCRTALGKDDSQQKIIREWERAYLKNFPGDERHGLFAHCLEPDHPTGKLFRYEPLFNDWVNLP